MNRISATVRAVVEKKLHAKRVRTGLMEETRYDDLHLDPEFSKAFGFPDNSQVQDPDISIYNNSVSLETSGNAE